MGCSLPTTASGENLDTHSESHAHLPEATQACTTMSPAIRSYCKQPAHLTLAVQLEPWVPVHEHETV